MREWDFTRDAHALRLRVCEWGNSSSKTPTIIICHGFLEQGAAWHEVAKQLPGRILAYDQRGHGLSEHVGRGGFYHFWDYVSDLDHFIDALEGPIVLIGHSMGGSVATLYAALRPARLHKLILIEGLGPKDTVPSAVPRARQFLTSMRQLPEHPPLKSIYEAMGRMQRHNPALTDDAARALASRITQALPDGQLSWTWDAKHRMRSPTPFSWPQFRQFIERFECPSLLIRGDRSRFLPDNMAEREACVPKHQLQVITDAGHLIHHDQADALAKAITHFITEPT